MEIKVYKTFEIKDEWWKQIADGFNESFGLNTLPERMKNAFCTRNRNGFGYHAIAFSDEGEVMGYNVFSPVFYKNGLKTVVSGSTYVRPKFRSHEMLFMNMVQALRKAVIADGFEVEIGVPNHNSEKFALKILKFIPVAELNYFVLPFNFSKSFNKNNLRLLDWIVKIFSKSHILCQMALSKLFNFKEKDVKYDLDYDENYWDYRLGQSGYKHFKKGVFQAHWLPYNENGINAVYLMDFREGKQRTYHSLMKALKEISKTEEVDMILFVGFLHMKQLGLFKCPPKLVPKRLPLTYYVLNKSDKDKYADMRDSKNWNFSLINFDAR